MTTKICPICVVVSFLWLVFSVGVAEGFLAFSAFLVPIALLMGGTVVGIANRSDSIGWKTLIILLGMPLAYFAVSHLSMSVVKICPVRSRPNGFASYNNQLTKSFLRIYNLYLRLRSSDF